MTRGSASQTDVRSNHLAVVLTALLALTLPVLAVISPVNHDETQYLAGAYFTSRGLRPFADFLHLQTPYQLYVFAPVFSWFPAHTFIASRLLTGLVGAAIIAMIYAGQRKGGVSAPHAAATCALLWLCHAFMFGVTVVRNDALPALLLSMAMVLAMPALSASPKPGSIRWAGVGFLMALAVGVKISYAAPLAASLVAPGYICALGCIDARAALRSTAAIAIGAIAGILPLALVRQWAPQAFDYGVFAYHAAAPFAWYRANGLGHTLTLAAKLGDVAVVLLRGPALAALAIYGGHRIGSLRRSETQRPILLFLDALCTAGIIALFAPTPTWRQYAIPLLPPLFLGLGLVWEDYSGKGRAIPWTVKLPIVGGALIGLGQPIFQVVSPWATPVATPSVATKEAHLLARLARDEHASGLVATLSPEIAIDSGLRLDPAFASGPFAYRTGDTIDPAKQDLLRIVSPATVAHHLALTRPAVIVTGYENFDHVDTVGLELPLVAYARAHRYVRFASPYGQAVFWLRARGNDRLEGPQGNASHPSGTMPAGSGRRLVHRAAKNE